MEVQWTGCNKVLYWANDRSCNDVGPTQTDHCDPKITIGLNFGKTVKLCEHPK